MTERVRAAPAAQKVMTSNAMTVTRKPASAWIGFVGFGAFAGLVVDFLGSAAVS